MMVRQYIESIRAKGGTINTDIVISGARGILETLDRTRLSKFGGPATLTTAWAKSLLNFRKRRGTSTKSAMPVERFREVKAAFLQEIVDIVKMEEVPSKLILNWDQTGLNLVPALSWTMADRSE